MQQYALVQGIRQPPFKGGRGKCPGCHKTMVAHCGEIESHHWQHFNGSLCDPWRKGKGEWHHTWQKNFPKDWREVFIEDPHGEKHFADVKTDKELIIEFQNPGLSPSTIRIREDFYGEMVWVINTETFDKHLLISSTVTKRLRWLDESIRDEQYTLKEMLDDGISEKRDVVNGIERKIKDDNYEKEKSTKLLNEYKNRMRQPKDLVEAVFRWITDKNSGILGVEQAFYIQMNYRYRETLLKIKGDLNTKHRDLTPKKRILQEIEKLEDNEINGRKAKRIPYKYITTENCQQVYSLPLKTKDTFFPEYELLTEFEWKRHASFHEDYEYFWDASETIRNIQEKIDEITNIIQGYEIEFTLIKDQITGNALKWLKEEIGKLEKEFEKINSRRPQLVKNWWEEDTKLKELQHNRPIELQKEQERHERKKKEIQKRYKGQYELNRWKREHKAWREARRPIFFDNGGSDLFMCIDNKFKKLDKTKFIILAKESTLDEIIEFHEPSEES